MMAYWAEYKCSQHSNAFECPDSIIFFKSRPRQYGVIFHDGGESFVEIAFCPWCGSSLKTPTKKKELKPLP
jgi:hypothetical protein